jgi:hypothetical protein
MIFYLKNERGFTMHYEIQFANRKSGKISVASVTSMKGVIAKLSFCIDDAIDNNIRVVSVDRNDRATTIYCTGNLESIKTFQRAFVDDFDADNYYRVVSFARGVAYASIKCKTADFDNDFAELDYRRIYFADILTGIISDLVLDPSSIENLFTVIIYEMQRVIAAVRNNPDASIDDVEALL